MKHIRIILGLVLVWYLNASADELVKGHSTLLTPPYETIESYNLQTGVIELQPVFASAHLRAEHTIELSAGTTRVLLGCTQHVYEPVLCRWIGAAQLQPGHALLHRSGAILTIDQVTHHDEPLELHEPSVADNFNYFLPPSDILVHNAPFFAIPSFAFICSTACYYGGITWGTLSA